MTLLEFGEAEMQLHRCELELARARLQMARARGEHVAQPEAALRRAELLYAQRKVEILEQVEKVLARQAETGSTPAGKLEKLRDDLAIARKELEQIRGDR